MTYVLGTEVCFIIYKLSIVLENVLQMFVDVTVGYVLGRNQLLLLVVEFVSNSLHYDFKIVNTLETMSLL